MQSSNAKKYTIRKERIMLPDKIPGCSITPSSLQRAKKTAKMDNSS